jgi:hypothetical protein
MSQPRLSARRARQLHAAAGRTRLLVIGDVMLDQFIWGSVTRISPEAPVPVLDFQRESFMPGGAANVARNLTALGVNTTLFGAVGRDLAARQLGRLLAEQGVSCRGLVEMPHRRRRHFSIDGQATGGLSHPTGGVRATVFGDAARDLLAAICLSFIKTAPGKWTLRNLLLAIRTRE